MICKLCHQDKLLIKESHIIPEFMYKPLYNEHHKIHLFEYPKVSPPKLISKGYYEKNILCQECDNVIIGKLETYASKVLQSGKNEKNKPLTAWNYKTHQGMRVAHIEGIDYTKFKLFLLSILWRASISKHRYFEGIFLGDHEEIIRKAILTNDPLDEDLYQVCIIACNEDVLMTRELILNPKQTKGDEPYISFYITGAFYLFSISRNPIFNLFKVGHLKISNEIEIPFFDLNSVKQYIKSVWNMNF